MAQNERSDTPDDAARKIMVEIQQDLLRFLTRRLGDEEEAHDVLHDFYVRVLTRIDDVRDTEKLRAWMRQVLETTLIDHYRTQGTRRRAEAKHQRLELAAAEAGDEMDLVVCMCLYKLLPTLKPEYADVLWRADLIGESRESIAAALGIEENNVRVRLHRARQALKQRLLETCRTCPIHGYLDCACDRAERLSTGLKSETA